jgi:hypothetical protein
VSNYAGAGTQVSAVDNRVTFEGTYELVESDCEQSLIEGLWFPSDGESFHTFVFKDLTEIDDWIAHGEEDAWSPVAENPINWEQWYITDMKAPYDDSITKGEYHAVEDAMIDIIAVQLTHDAIFDFNTN